MTKIDLVYIVSMCIVYADRWADIRVTAVRYRGTIHDFVMLNAITDDPAPRGAIEQAS